MRDLTMALDGKPTDKDLAEARRLVALHEARFRRLEEAVRRPVWAAPRPGDEVVPEMGGSALEFPRLAGMRELVRYLALRSRLRLHVGKPDAAVDDLVLARQVGAKMAQGRTGFVAHFVGIGIETIVDADILRLARNSRLDDRHLTRLQAVVSERVGLDSADAVLRYEFDEVVQLAASLPDLASDRDLTAKVPAKLRADFMRAPLLVRPDVVRTAAPYYAAALGVMTLPYVPNRRDRNLPPILPPNAPDWSEVLTGGATPTEASFRTFLTYAKAHPNLFGRSMIDSTPSLLASFEVAERQRLARARMTLLGLAALRYEKKTARPVATLAELVRARLLQAVPADPFDGKALRYDPRRRVVWSVGRDAKDGGGRPRTRIDLVTALP